ncbi:hypothetical protein K9K77_02520 [Candidatus Babeliales bacterium]|nr:hypothetical protein [Candidatus Babeliales bacterium]
MNKNIPFLLLCSLFIQTNKAAESKNNNQEIFIAPVFYTAPGPENKKESEIRMNALSLQIQRKTEQTQEPTGPDLFEQLARENEYNIIVQQPRRNAFFNKQNFPITSNIAQKYKAHARRVACLEGQEVGMYQPTELILQLSPCTLTYLAIVAIPYSLSYVACGIQEGIQTLCCK